ncbi:MAG: D-glycero-beta-D-manno-heptose 1-phosphate adenylyltransferase [Bdellovibrionales bacterium]|nr:D-glycero-beta-D-manno-heptose 1-phosphate adenylyltransferase [Bdellovibrionales bacterium]
MGEVLNRQQLKDKIDSMRATGKVVFTNGCFDLLHVGHVRYLQDARALGDTLVVAVNSDASVKRLKGETRPLQTESDRAEILAALGSVDLVTIFEEDTPRELVELLSPDVLVKGGDWPVEKIEGHQHVLANGGEVKSLPFHDGRSTTKIIEKMDS